jgi:hypothetical protein
MSPAKSCLTFIACGAAAMLPATAFSAADAVELKPFNEPSAVFSESEATFTYAVAPPERFDGTLAWTHSVGPRTLARGEAPVTKSGDYAIRVKIPPVRDGIALATTLTTALQPRGGGTALASHSRSVWIFPEDPFSGRTQWLKSLGITLFDPVGDTRDAFEGLKIPFRQVRDTAALEHVDGGVVIVGEGISWGNFRSLGEVLPAVAAKGIPVLCLAPTDGGLVFPGSQEADTPAPSGIAFRREDLIRKRDKRLDGAAWTHRGELVFSRMALAGGRNLVIVEVNPDETGWPWLEFDYASHGKLIVSGFGVIKHWDASPNARYFLADLLEEFSQNRGDEQ